MLELLNIGYACINTCCNEKEGISVNRGMQKATFEKRGLNYVSELIIENLKDLQKILEWNQKNNIYIYRMSSSMFPWMSQYKIKELPNFDQIETLLKECGDFIKGSLPIMRVSFHPGPYVVLASTKSSIVNKSIKEINQHAEIMDIMGLDQSYQYPINIHLNTTEGGKESVYMRFKINSLCLSKSALKRLVVENDDGPNQFDVVDLYENIYKTTGCPITFDTLHFLTGPKNNWRWPESNISPDSQTYLENYRHHYNLAKSTWNNFIPLFHHSSSKKWEDEKSSIRAHSDYIYDLPTEGFDPNIDWEIEAKAKEQAVLNLRESLYTPLNRKYSLEKFKEIFNGKEEKIRYSQGKIINNLSVKKGDFVTLKNGLSGTIIKYPSNKEIHVQIKPDQIEVIDKSKIVEVKSGIK